MHVKKFTKEQRSTFSYWYYHWKTFNHTAWKLGAWKIKHLFHDIEKPWLKLALHDYSKVQRIHRMHNKHHLEYRIPEKRDWVSMVIDWECSRFTKELCPRTAIEEIEYKYANGKLTAEEYNILISTARNLKLTK